jgi:hypothetical protein
LADPDVILHGFDELARALEDSQSIFVPLASPIVFDSLDLIQSIIEVYPPQPSRTRAKSFNTYVRGTGSYPKSAFVSADEPGGYSVKGKIALQKAGKVRFTSQNLKGDFEKNVTVRGSDVIGSLANTATYSGWVIGSRNSAETPHQVSWHMQTGWVSKESAIEQAMPTINQNVKDLVTKYMKALKGA